MLLFGDPAAILVLWCIVAYTAVQVGQLHADCSPPSIDRDVPAVQRGALFRPRAPPESRCFGEDQLGEPWLVFRTAKHGQQRARTVLFHLYRRSIDVECAFV